MGVLVEQIAAQAVREHLLAKLPAKVAEVNALRAAALKATVPGPYNLTAETPTLRISKTDPNGSFVDVVMATTSLTATQVASAVNGTAGLNGVASVDSDDRLVLTSPTAPSGSTSSAVAVGPEATESAAGTNALFGWDAGGESVTRAPLVAPGYKGVADGWPLLNDLGAGFWVIIGDRESIPVEPSPRRDEHLVGLELAVFCPVTNEQAHRDREAIQACVRCVRECMLTDAGRQAGRASSGDIVLVGFKAAKIPGRPWKFRGENAPNALFDVAALQLNVRVFERPASS